MEAGLSCSSCNLVLMLQMHKNQIQDWNLKLKIVIDLAQSSYLFSNHSCILERFFRLKSGKNVKGKPTTFPQNISFSCSFFPLFSWQYPQAISGFVENSRTQHCVDLRGKRYLELRKVQKKWQVHNMLLLQWREKGNCLVQLNFPSKSGLFHILTL